MHSDHTRGPGPPGLRDGHGTSVAGVGQAKGLESRSAARRAAAEALSRLAPGEKAGWAIAFCGGRHDGEAYLAGIRDEIGDLPVVGGAAIGTIAREGLGYGGWESVIAVIPASAGAPRLLLESMDDVDERTAGERLGRRIGGTVEEGASVLLFYDSMRSSSPQALHAGSHLMDGIYEGIGLTDVHLAGGGTLGDFTFSDSFLFAGESLVRHAVLAVVLPSAVRLRSRVLRACLPTSSFMTITRIDGAVVHEIDHQPAVKALERIAGGPIDASRARDLALRTLLGEQHGDLFGPPDGSTYVNRLIVSIDPDAGSLTLFEPDFRAGSRVQVLTRDNKLMFDSAHKGTRELMAEISGQNCLLVLYVDCAGRAAMLCGSEEEEAQIVADAVDGDVPFVGFYSGVEIAPLMGRSRPLDLTGVLIALCQDGAP